MSVALAAAPLAPRSRLPRPLTIFVPHGSPLLTDHLAHGDGLVAREFVNGLAERGHRLIVAAPHADLAAPLPPSVEVHVYEGRGDSASARARDYLRFVRRLYDASSRTHAIDLVHQLNPVVRGMTLSLPRGVPIVLGTFVGDWKHTHPDLNVESPSLRERATALFKVGIDLVQQHRAEALLATTPYALNRIPLSSRLRRKIFFVPHGVDATRFMPASRRAESGSSAILCIGTLVRHKGIFTLLDAFDCLAQRDARIRLIVGGSGPEEWKVRALVAGSRFRDRIDLLGHVSRDGVPSLMRRAGVFCLPSYGEPLGQVVLEAMSCGLPVVASSAGGPKFVLPSEGRRLVRPGDPQALAAALEDVVGIPGRGAAMGAVNRAAVLERFAWPRVIDRLEAVYGHVLGFGATPQSFGP